MQNKGKGPGLAGENVKGKPDAQRDRISKNRNSRKNITILLAVIAGIVWAAFLLLKKLLCDRYGLTFSGIDLVDGIIDNILGILPPIILFNFAYEYLTQNHMSEEMSQQITNTLMSDPQSISLIDEPIRRRFIDATLVSLLKEEKGKMVSDLIRPYLESEYNLRKYYKYNILIRDSKEPHPIFTAAKYMVLQEKLVYRKLYTSASLLHNDFRIAFFIKASELDENLRLQSFVFREDLNIDPQDLDALINETAAAQMRFVEEYMDVRAYINDTKASILGVLVNKTGVFIDFHVDTEIGQEVKVEVGFSMPQLKGKSKFFVSISEPTYNPIIEVTYNEEDVEIVMIPFLNGATISRDATHFNGMCEIAVEDEWIMPMSGVVFIINSK